MHDTVNEQTLPMAGTDGGWVNTAKADRVREYWTSNILQRADTEKKVRFLFSPKSLTFVIVFDTRDHHCHRCRCTMKLLGPPRASNGRIARCSQLKVSIVIWLSRMLFSERHSQVSFRSGSNTISSKLINYSRHSTIATTWRHASVTMNNWIDHRRKNMGRRRPTTGFSVMRAIRRIFDPALVINVGRKITRKDIYKTYSNYRLDAKVAINRFYRRSRNCRPLEHRYTDLRRSDRPYPLSMLLTTRSLESFQSFLDLSLRI